MLEAAEVLAIGCTVMGMLGVVLGFVFFIRYLRYRENTILAEGGHSSKEEGNNYE